ncbi:MAG TPA: hypothetical protein K8V32_00615 [Enteractinococcus helveticum]|uniref:Uncharacterized protein n=1 Tax=Enteractinococcus helveticum TaxID=1837282 RepID=A0A921FLT3_9MICC|nr:hypothetical protein [Enteractinococcus helveticum]
MSKSTAHQVAQSLEANGFLSKHPGGGYPQPTGCT